MRRSRDADILGRLVRYVIMTFVVMIALSQVEIGGDMVQRTFLIILGGLMLALALAFGIGGHQRCRRAAAQSLPPRPNASAIASMRPARMMRKVRCTMSPPTSTWLKAIITTNSMIDVAHQPAQHVGVGDLRIEAVILHRVAHETRAIRAEYHDQHAR